MPNIPGILGYIQPGAYSIARTRATSLALGGGPRILCIVGLGQTELTLISAAAGSQAYGTGVAADDVQIESENVHTLSKFPLVEKSVNVWVDGALLQRGGDEWTYESGQDQYYLQDVDADGDPVAQNASTAVATMLILLEPLALGQSFIIAYVAEDDINDPETFFTPEDLYAKHGFPSMANTLALGAQLAFENGAPVVMACQALPITDQDWEVTTSLRNRLGLGPAEPIMDSDWSLTFAELEKEEIDLISSLPYISDDDTPVLGTGATAYFFNIHSQLRAHCLTMSLVENRKERQFVIGSPKLEDVNSMLGTSYTNLPAWLTDTSVYTGDGYVDETYGSTFRGHFLSPDKIIRVVAGVVEELSGMHLACAYAGKLSGTQYLPEPMTRKTLVGFNILRGEKYSQGQMNLMAASGVVVVEPLTSGGRIRHGLTTINTGAVEEEEPSVIAVRDYVSKQVRITLENRFIGRPITDTLVGDMSSVLKLFLGSLLAQVLINNYAGASVRIDSQLATQANVTFDIQPIYPLNWIKIEFSIGLL